MTIRRVAKMFKRGSVCVIGQRGRGKDMLMSNVAVRNGKYYSNVNYGGDFNKLDFAALDIKNDYTDLISGNVNEYHYPYVEGADIYISDIGVYFPSQYCNELNRKYPRLPYFLALSRQLGEANVHLNVQALNRAWDKFREQSDQYILCLGIVKPLIKLGIVVQRIRVYEKYESALTRVIPFRVPKPKLLAKREVKQAYEIEKAKYEQSNGRVDEYLLVYFNKSKYDTRYFKTLLAKEGTHTVTDDSDSNSSDTE